MKKVVFSFIGAAIIIGAVVFNISISSRGDSLSDLALMNIEALADNENGGTHNHGPTERTLFGKLYCGNTNQVNCSY